MIKSVYDIKFVFDLGIESLIIIFLLFFPTIYPNLNTSTHPLSNLPQPSHLLHPDVFQKINIISHIVPILPP